MFVTPQVGRGTIKICRSMLGTQTLWLAGSVFGLQQASSFGIYLFKRGVFHSLLHVESTDEARQMAPYDQVKFKPASSNLQQAMIPLSQMPATSSNQLSQVVSAICSPCFLRAASRLRSRSAHCKQILAKPQLFRFYGIGLNPKQV